MPNFLDDDISNRTEEYAPEVADEKQMPVARPNELTPADWRCAACGRPNETLVDLSAGFEQEYVEDCAICCRPNLISLLIDPDTFIVSLHNELEYE